MRAALAAARCRARREDGGALLGAALLLMVVALVAVSLLGMLLVDVRASSTSTQVDQVNRAVSGALDVGVNRLKTSPLAQLGTPTSCPPPAGASLGAVTIDGVEVTLRCVASAPNVPPVAGGGGDDPALLLLGNYNGGLDDLANAELSGVLGTAVQNVAGFLNLFVANGPGLIHAGPEPLRVAGKVRVRQAALAYRYSADGNTAVAGPSPAISVGGSFEQGDCGLLGCVSLVLFGIPVLSTPACGVLDPSFPPDGDFGLRVSSVPAPVCNLGRGAPQLNDPRLPAPASWNAAAVRARQVSLPGCAAPGGVVSLSPGAYSRIQTFQLNQWFRVGNCDGVTFWFAPGDYYFDVSGLVGEDRNSLVLDDPTSNVVFGLPAGWNPAIGKAPDSAFPVACDTTQPGVSVTLSSRTTVKHRNGRVALCGTPASPGAPTTSLLHQPASSDTVGWGAVPTAATPADGIPSWTNPSAGTRSSAPVPVTYPANGGPWDTSETGPTGAYLQCLSVCSPALTFTGFSDPGAPAPSGELTRALLRIRGDSRNVGGPTTIVNVVYGDGSGQCSGTFGSTMAAGWNAVDVDLVALCRSRGLTDATQLEGAIITVRYSMTPICILWTCLPPPEAWIDYVWLETTTSYRPPSSMEVAVGPAEGREVSFFGRVDVPRTQIEVRWYGSSNRAPIFVGGVVARALASAPPNSTATRFSTGLVAASGIVPGARRVQLRAIRGGRLAATAEVFIDDSDPSGTVLDPGRDLEILAWDLCNRPADAATCASG